MPRVLFVDDDPSVLIALRRSLRTQPSPWQLEFVTSGAEALKRLNEKPFDVIVSDLQMPRMSGQQLLEEVAVAYPDIVQVILSGIDEKARDQEHFAAATVFLAKPCSSETLRSTIQRAIFLTEFFRRGALNRLIESLAELTETPDLHIRIRPASESSEGCPSTVAEIACPDLGLRLTLPIQQKPLQQKPQAAQPVFQETI